MTLENFIDQVDAEENAARLDAIKAVKQYDTARTNEAYDKAQKDQAGNVLREWFKTHPEETELVDGEWGLRAWMETRRTGTRKFDLTSIIENNPSLFARLVSVRALQIDYDVAEAQGLADEVKRYEMPSGESQALQVRQLRR